MTCSRRGERRRRPAPWSAASAADRRALVPGRAGFLAAADRSSRTTRFSRWSLRRGMIHFSNAQVLLRASPGDGPRHAVRQRTRSTHCDPHRPLCATVQTCSGPRRTRSGDAQDRRHAPHHVARGGRLCPREQPRPRGLEAGSRTGREAGKEAWGSALPHIDLPGGIRARSRSRSSSSRISSSPRKPSSGKLTPIPFGATTRWI